MDHRAAVETLASERYLLDEMTEGERESFEDHFFSCDECAADVRAGARMKTGAGAGWASPEVLRHVPVAKWYHSTALPWAIAATLAIAVGYQTLALRPAGALAGQDAVILKPLTLRAASRGTEPALTVEPAGVLTLAVDLGGRRYRRVAYELRTAGGALIASGESDAPPAGAPLMLLVPAKAVRASEHYVLLVQEPGNADLTKEEYRFRVEPS